MTAIAAGDVYTCAAMASGGAKCWGFNSSGELGDGTITQRMTPVEVKGLAGQMITTISGGTGFICSLTDVGKIFCWGDNRRGQLGNGSYVSSKTPVEVLLQTGPAKALSVGNTHACLVDGYGNIYCWGYNDATRNLNLPQETSMNFPIYVGGESDFQAISAGTNHSCGTTTQGAIKCFGSNTYGQFGIGTPGTTDYVTVSTLVQNL